MDWNQKCLNVGFLVTFVLFCAFFLSMYQDQIRIENAKIERIQKSLELTQSLLVQVGNHATRTSDTLLMYIASGTPAEMEEMQTSEKQ